MGPEQGSAGQYKESCTRMWGFSTFFWEAVGNVCMLQAELTHQDQFHIKYSQCLSIPALFLCVSTALTPNQLLLLFLLTTSVSVFEFLLPFHPLFKRIQTRAMSPHFLSLPLLSNHT